MFRRHICSGFAFDSITFYSLLAIFNDSSETIRTKGTKDKLCAFFPGERGCILGCLERFSCLRKKNEAEVFILLWKFQGSLPSIFTLTNYSSLISMKNSDVKLFHVCHYISRSLRTCKSLKYFSTVQSCTFKLELTLNKLFCLKFFPS